MKMHPSVNKVKSYVIKSVRTEDDEPVETKFESSAYYTVSKVNKHWLLELGFDFMVLIYDLKDEILLFPEEDNFFTEYFSIIKISHRQFLLTGNFILSNDDNEIINEYRFVGEIDWLPPGIRYLQMPGKESQGL